MPSFLLLLQPLGELMFSGEERQGFPVLNLHEFIHFLISFHPIVSIVRDGGNRKVSLNGILGRIDKEGLI